MLSSKRQPHDLSRWIGERAFAIAKDQYAEWGIDVDSALARLDTVAISLHCWQGDDVGGFENTGEQIGGGLAVTGHYLGLVRAQPMS